MDENRRLERNARRRRSLVAWAASLAIHAAFFGLLFSVKSSPPSLSHSLAVSIRIAGPSQSGLVTEANAPLRSRAVSASLPAPRPLAAASGDSRADGPSGLSEALPGSIAAGLGAVGSTSGGAGSIGGIASGGESVAVLAERVGRAIEARKTYPEAARRRGAEGIVALKLRVAEDGRLLAAKLAASSGSTLLDRAALDLASSVFPVDNIARKELELAVSVRYELKR